MADQTASAAPVSVSDLPPLLTIPQAAAVLLCAGSTVRRRLAAPDEDLWPIRLGRGPRAPVRVARDELLRYAGLLGRDERLRRDRRRADAELHAVAARLGIDSHEDGNGNPRMDGHYGTV